MHTSIAGVAGRVSSHRIRVQAMHVDAPCRNLHLPRLRPVHHLPATEPCTPSAHHPPSTWSAHHLPSTKTAGLCSAALRAPRQTFSARTHPALADLYAGDLPAAAPRHYSTSPRRAPPAPDTRADRTLASSMLPRPGCCAGGPSPQGTNGTRRVLQPARRLASASRDRCCEG